jgi:hypothetical protein
MQSLDLIRRCWLCHHDIDDWRDRRYVLCNDGWHHLVCRACQEAFSGHVQPTKPKKTLEDWL